MVYVLTQKYQLKDKRLINKLGVFHLLKALEQLQK